MTTNSQKTLLMDIGKASLSAVAFYYSLKWLIHSIKQLSHTNHPDHYEKQLGRDLSSLQDFQMFPDNPQYAKIYNSVHAKYADKKFKDRTIAVGMAAVSGLVMYGSFRCGRSIIENNVVSHTSVTTSIKPAK